VVNVLCFNNLPEVPSNTAIALSVTAAAGPNTNLLSAMALGVANNTVLVALPTISVPIACTEVPLILYSAPLPIFKPGKVPPEADKVQLLFVLSHNMVLLLSPFNVIPPPSAV
jgi:hypothetical protein